MFKERAAKLITQHYGQRCDDFEPECICCQIWAEFDKHFKDVEFLKDKNQPLKVKIIDDSLVIHIGIDTLAWAAENAPMWYSLGYLDKRIHDSKVKVVDLKELAKDVALEINREREDGSTPLTNLLDDAILAAFEDGSLAFE